MRAGLSGVCRRRGTCGAQSLLASVLQARYANPRRSSLGEQVSPSGRISGTPSKAVAGAVKETSQGTFAKGVDTKWPETQTVAKGVTSLLPRKSEDIFLFKENASVPPRG